MRSATFFLAALITIFHGFAEAAEKIRMRVTEFPPQYFQQNGRWVGLDIDLVEAIAKDAGMTVEFVELPWSRAMEQLKTGEIDVLANVTRTPDRETLMHFLGPVRSSKRVLVVRKENLAAKISTLDELANTARQSHHPIGIQQNVKYSDEFDARLASDPTFAQVFDALPKAALLPKKVGSGNNFGFIEDSYFVNYSIKTNPEFQDLAIHSFTLSNTPSYFGVSKQLAPALLQRLETSFKHLEANGTLAKVRGKWE